MFTNSNILITGGTGSIGYELTTQLLSYNPSKIIIFTRNESAQVAMKRHFNDHRLKFCIGDIRDREALTKACAGIDYIFHLAALKHVPVCEDQPLEALKTNVCGTQNIIEAALHNKVKRVINMSTDKAADPSNFYGMTKALAEKLVTLSNHLSKDTTFLSIRGGNILGASGSVLHVFKKQIKEGNQVGVTDRRMIRFFMSLEEVTSLLIRAAVEGQGGEVFIMAMPACKIVDLAEVLIDLSGKKDVKIVELGIRPGEKVNELLISEYEGQHAVQYDDKLIVILPADEHSELKQYYSSYPALNSKTYAANQVLMTKDKIKEMLENSGFIESL